jgi:hypothetical protein
MVLNPARRASVFSSMVQQEPHLHLVVLGSPAQLVGVAPISIQSTSPVLATLLWFPSILSSECVWIVAEGNRYNSWAVGSKSLRFPSPNRSPVVISWTRPPGVRWNACEDINRFLIWFLSSFSLRVLPASIRVFVAVPILVSKADSLFIPSRSWPS